MSLAILGEEIAILGEEVPLSTSALFILIGIAILAATYVNVGGMLFLSWTNDPDSTKKWLSGAHTQTQALLAAWVWPFVVVIPFLIRKFR